MARQYKQRQGVERARWLAELAAALEQARRCIPPLVARSPASSDWFALAERIAQASAEADSLRRGRTWPVGNDFPPTRIKFPPAGGGRGA